MDMFDADEDRNWPALYTVYHRLQSSVEFLASAIKQYEVCCCSRSQDCSEIQENVPNESLAQEFFFFVVQSLS